MHHPMVNFLTVRFVGLLVLLLPVVQSSSQALYTNKAKMNETRFHYRDASNMYLGFNRNGDREAALHAAENLYKGRLYQEALPWYEYADSLALINDPEEIFGYFECLKAMKRYGDADRLVRTHIDTYADRREFQLHDNKLTYYKKLESFEGAQLKNLKLNSAFSDISPTVYQRWLYFVSTRPATNNKEVHRINMQPFFNLYAVPDSSDMLQAVKPSGKFGKPSPKIRYQTYEASSLPNGINKRYHDGPVMVVPAGNMLFFTTNWSMEKRPRKHRSDINLMVYYCKKEGDLWSKPEAFPYNSFEWSNQHAWFDEATSTLYFSSDRPGGQGGFDIWKSRLAGGNWLEPENLGANVNTPKSEVFPALSPEGKLIFSSNGWPGLGGLDLFMVDEPNLPPLNLMAGMNSEVDDFGLVFTAPETGYLVSNRDGGTGDDDIYSFTLDLKQVLDLMRPARVITAIFKDADTGQPIDGVRVTISNHFDKQYVTTGQKSIQDTVAWDIGDPNKPELVVKIERDGYEPREMRISSWPDDQLLLDLSQTLKAIRKVEPVIAGGDKLGRSGGGKNNGDDGKLIQVRMLENQKFIIYFDFDKFNIRKDAAEILAKVTYVLLEEYEAAEVLLTGHTDSRGTNTYNDRLSQNRVMTARKWLINKGVSPKRIRTAYKGELELAVRCKDPLYRDQNTRTCLTEAEHQLNRRVEIDILNMIN